MSLTLLRRPWDGLFDVCGDRCDCSIQQGVYGFPQHISLLTCHINKELIPCSCREQYISHLLLLPSMHNMEKKHITSHHMDTHHCLSINPWMNRHKPLTKQQQNVRLHAWKNNTHSNKIRGQGRTKMEE